MTVPVALRHRACPVCRTEANGLSITSEPRGETQTLERLKTCWNQSVKDRIFLSYARCPNCGLLFCPEYFSEEQLNALYGQMPDNMAGVPPSVYALTQRGYFEVLKRFSHLKGHFLEVGSDLGFFTECAAQQGSFDEFWLFEPKDEVQANLRKILTGKKSHLLQTMLDTKVLPDRKITVVVMVHVLDHLLDPKGVLVDLKKKLAPEAVALFVTHDERSWLAKLLKSGWGGYSLEHPHMFNKSSIAHLLKEAGYKVLAIEPSANYFPLSFLVQQGLAAVGIKTGPWKWLSGVTLRIKLGNTITLASPA